MSYCAIDFGTSNSAVAVPVDTSISLAPVENTSTTLPTAVFFNAEDHSRAFGRAAIAAYVDGYDGRLMRSIKSILGSPLSESGTDLGAGSAIRYTDVVALFIAHLVRRAQSTTGAPVDRAVLGRPVFFVDGQPKADRLAVRQLTEAAHAAGLRHVEFQYEPIAAAFDYESRLQKEGLVLVADIGGGTSDFSLVRVGPARRTRAARHDDVLSHNGVHLAGTDFDRRIELTNLLPALGYRSVDTSGREIPNRIYFDLATWHLINTVYTPKRIAELQLMRPLYREPAHHRRLMRVVERRLGHALAALAERAKIEVSAGGQTSIDLGGVETALARAFDEQQLIDAIRDETAQIVGAARATVDMAGVAPHDVTAVYFTGGSTGVRILSDSLAPAFPDAEPVFGDRLASVATGLGIHAQRIFA